MITKISATAEPMSPAEVAELDHAISTVCDELYSYSHSFKTLGSLSDTAVTVLDGLFELADKSDVPKHSMLYNQLKTLLELMGGVACDARERVDNLLRFNE